MTYVHFEGSNQPKGRLIPRNFGDRNSASFGEAIVSCSRYVSGRSGCSNLTVDLTVRTTRRNQRIHRARRMHRMPHVRDTFQGSREVPGTRETSDSQDYFSSSFHVLHYRLDITMLISPPQGWSQNSTIRIFATFYLVGSCPVIMKFTIM